MNWQPWSNCSVAPSCSVLLVLALPPGARALPCKSAPVLPHHACMHLHRPPTMAQLLTRPPLAHVKEVHSQARAQQLPGGCHSCQTRSCKTE